MTDSLDFRKHANCAQCGEMVDRSKLVVYPWGRVPGQSRMLICPACAVGRRREEARQRNAAAAAPKVKAKVEETK